MLNRRQRKTKKRFSRLLIGFCLATFVFFIFRTVLHPGKEEKVGFVSPVALLAETQMQEQSSPIPIPSQNAQPFSSSLSEAVQNTLVGVPGTYGIVIKNLTTGKGYNFNDHQSFESGSLYKLWVMATAYDQIQNNSLDENEEISQDINYLDQEFGIIPDPNDSGTLTLTVNEALNKMITVSDNDSALLLTDKVTVSNVVEFLHDNGFNESIISAQSNVPTTTPYDIALFYEKLYNGRLANHENTQKMIDLLKQQKLNGKLPKYLPANVPIAHKTGELDSFSHDAGIVYSSRGDYIIVVMTDSDNPGQANEYIAGISLGVYNYFTKN